MVKSRTSVFLGDNFGDLNHTYTKYETGQRKMLVVEKRNTKTINAGDVIEDNGESMHRLHRK